MPARDRTYRTEAVVLRRKDFGEADRVLTLLTPEHGKVRVVAKGIRKPASRKAGHLDLFMRSKLLVAKGRDLDIITQAETMSAYRPLREYLLRGAYAARALIGVPSRFALRYSPLGRPGGLMTRAQATQ